MSKGAFWARFPVLGVFTVQFRHEHRPDGITAPRKAPDAATGGLNTTYLTDIATVSGRKGAGPETAGPKPPARNRRPETAGPKPPARNRRPETAGPKPPARNRRPETAGPKPPARNRRPETAGPIPSPTSPHKRRRAPSPARAPTRHPSPPSAASPVA